MKPVIIYPRSPEGVRMKKHAHEMDKQHQQFMVNMRISAATSESFNRSMAQPFRRGS